MSPIPPTGPEAAGASPWFAARCGLPWVLARVVTVPKPVPGARPDELWLRLRRVDTDAPLNMRLTELGRPFAALRGHLGAERRTRWVELLFGAADALRHTELPIAVAPGELAVEPGGAATATRPEDLFDTVWPAETRRIRANSRREWLAEHLSKHMGPKQAKVWGELADNAPRSLPRAAVVTAIRTGTTDPRHAACWPLLELYSLLSQQAFAAHGPEQLHIVHDQDRQPGAPATALLGELRRQAARRASRCEPGHEVLLSEALPGLRGVAKGEAHHHHLYVASLFPLTTPGLKERWRQAERCADLRVWGWLR